MFSFAVDRKYILAVPISKQSKATVKRGKPGILTVEECARLLSSCDEEILPAIALECLRGFVPSLKYGAWIGAA